MAMHRVQQRQLPLVLVAAGLPILPGLAGESKSYAGRLFGFRQVGALSQEDGAKALQTPAQEAGAAFADEALTRIYQVTAGHSYFLQEWGYQAWNLAQESPIRISLVHAATAAAVPRLASSFFRVRFDRLTPSQRRFHRAMAGLGPGPHRTSAVAEALGTKITSPGPARAQLIRKGMVYSPAHGEMAFTVPLFDEFMRRAMPELDA